MFEPTARDIDLELRRLKNYQATGQLISAQTGRHIYNPRVPAPSPVKQTATEAKVGTTVKS